MNKDDIIAELIKFASHSYNCDSLMPMWHKGSCDCGFSAFVTKLRAQGIDIKDGSIYEETPHPPLLTPDKPLLADEVKAALLSLTERVAADSYTTGGFLSGNRPCRVVNVMNVLDFICDAGVPQAEIDAVVCRVQGIDPNEPKKEDEIPPR